MKSKSNIEKKSRSLRTLVFYGVIVLVVVLIALFIKTLSVIRESKFDGAHQFTLSVGEGSRVLTLISFEPGISRLSMLTFSKEQNLSFLSLNRQIGIIPDGFIKMKDDLEVNGDALTILQSLILHWNSVDTNITFYDLFRLWFYSHKN